MDLNAAIEEAQSSASGGGGGGGGRGGGGAPGTTLQATILGNSETYSLDDSSKFESAVQYTSADGNFMLNIPQGTIAKDKNGQPLANLTIQETTSNPAAPEGKNILGIAMDFGPDGATFAPPITITISYDKYELPAGVSESDLTLAYYDSAEGTWVELPCSVNTVSNTIQAEISHFCYFAILYPETTQTSVAPPETSSAPSSGDTITNTQPGQETGKPVATSPASSEEETGSDTAPPTGNIFTTINWFLVGGILAGLVLLGGFVRFLIVRRY
jgi:hypothetical protein